MDERILIDSEVRRASTLPGAFYRSQRAFDEARDRVFARSWQFVGHRRHVELPGAVKPFDLLPGCLDEPLLLVRDEAGELRCLSNVCSHRGNLVQTTPGSCRQLRCGYHGRRFHLDGSFESMPEFADALDFPSAADDLPRVPLASFAGLNFVSLDPRVPFDLVAREMRERVGELPFDQFRFDPSRSRDYLVQAHWALYVDNYLEGFHVPFVHPDLARSLDYGSYRSELFPWSSLQLGVARGAQPVFEGTEVAAYYFWLFPNTMLNFYPWGLSVNVVQPVALDRTRVLFRTYVWKPELIDQGPGGDLDKVEREDEHIVEQVQRGMRSRLYKAGRYSPAREATVHHFHRLMQLALEDEPLLPLAAERRC